MTEAPGLREQKKDLTRTAIAQAALRLTEDRSYAEVTVAEIAGAAGVSRRTVSNYYASKADCFAGAVGARFFQDVIRPLLLAETGSIGERLALAFRAVEPSYWHDLYRLHQIARAEPEVAAAVAFAEKVHCDQLVDTVVAASRNQIDRLRLTISVAVIATCVSATIDHWLDDGSRGGTAALARLVAQSFDVLDLSWLDPHLDAIRSLQPDPDS